MLLGLKSINLDPAGMRQKRDWQVFESIAAAEAWVSEALPGECRRYQECELHTDDVYSIAVSLLKGAKPEDLDMRFVRVSAAGFGAWAYGRIWFTQYKAPKEGWVWGTTSDNGVSAYPSGRIHADGTIDDAVESWNPYVKHDTTSWNNWKTLSEEDVQKRRYSRAFYGY